MHIDFTKEAVNFFECWPAKTSLLILVTCIDFHNLWLVLFL